MEKTKIKSYCEYVISLNKNNIHRIYHDNYHGFKIEDDNELFERLILEINQAGLSWDIILNKQKKFQKAFNNFNIKKIANYKTKDKKRLLNDSGIIRNKLKIDATIYNANIILNLQKEYGSFKKWLDIQKCKSKQDWVKLFKKTFKFTGGEITGEFLMSTGYIPGAHIKSCPIYKKLNKIN